MEKFPLSAESMSRIDDKGLSSIIYQKLTEKSVTPIKGKEAGE